MNGSIKRFGVAAVLKCETDEPPAKVAGVYIATRPVAASRPAVKKLEAILTFSPSHIRLFVLIVDAARSALVISFQYLFVVRSYSRVV